MESSGSAGTVLIADNDERFRSLASGVLVTAGYRCVRVSDCQQSVEELRRERYDVGARERFTQQCLTNARAGCLRVSLRGAAKPRLRPVIRWASLKNCNVVEASGLPVEGAVGFGMVYPGLFFSSTLRILERTATDEDLACR